MRQGVLAITGALFFAIVAPVLSVVAPILPLMVLAYAGIGNPWLPLWLPFALGSAPAFLAGFLYVLIGSWLLRTKRIGVRRMPALGSGLCVLAFVVWFGALSMLNHSPRSSRDLGFVLAAAFAFSVMPAVGGYLTSWALLVCLRRVNRWADTTLGAHARSEDARSM
jgi:hypothetical protein